MQAQKSWGLVWLSSKPVRMEDAAVFMAWTWLMMNDLQKEGALIGAPRTLKPVMVELVGFV